jgi:chromosome segregation ATPase
LIGRDISADTAKALQAEYSARRESFGLAEVLRVLDLSASGSDSPAPVTSEAQQLADLLQAKASLEVKVVSTKSEVLFFERENQRLLSELAEASAEIDRLRKTAAQLSALRERHKEVVDELATLQQVISEKEETEGTLKQFNKKLASTRQQTIADLDSTKQELLRKEEELQALRDKLVAQSSASRDATPAVLQEQERRIEVLSILAVWGQSTHLLVGTFSGVGREGEAAGASSRVEC